MADIRPPGDARDEFLRLLAKEHSDLSNVHTEMLVSLFRLCNALEISREKNLQCFGLSEARLFVLLSIHYGGASSKAADIAKTLGVSRAAMTGLVESLVKDGLVERKDCAEDRRVCFLKPSKKGQNLINKVLPEHFRSLKKFAEALSQKEASQMTQFTDVLDESLRKLAPESPSKS